MLQEEPKNKVHHILAHSYFFYFLAFLVGLFLDFLFPLKIFKYPIMLPLGAILLILASFLIFWAQHTSRHLKKDNLSKETFCQGPYRYTRSPTHWGLFLLMLGFGIVINALFIMIFSVISFFIAKFVFLRKGEAILEKKYGPSYLEYKKSVRF